MIRSFLPPLRSGKFSSLSWFFTCLACLLGLATSSYAQTLSYNGTSLETSSSDVMATGQQNGVGAAVSGSTVYLAYATQTGAIALRLSQDGTGTVPLSSYSATVTVAGQAISTASVNSNPALLAVNGNLYLAWIDQNGNPDFVVSSDGGSSFGSTINSCSGEGAQASFSPALAYFNGNIYMYYASGSGNVFTYCVINPSTNSVVGGGNTGLAIGSSPSAIEYGTVLYVAFKDNGTGNTLNSYSTLDGVNYTLTLNTSTPNTSNTSTTSTSPSLFVDNNILFLMFRQNDANNHHLFYDYFDGATWAGPFEISNASNGGPPSVVIGPQGVAIDYFRQNASQSELQLITVEEN